MVETREALAGRQTVSLLAIGAGMQRNAKTAHSRLVQDRLKTLTVKFLRIVSDRIRILLNDCNKCVMN